MADKGRSNDVGITVLSLRSEIGWSQEQLAQKAGVSQTTIDKIERGLIKRTRFLPEIAAAFKVPVSVLDKTYAHRESLVLEERDSITVRANKTFEKYIQGDLPLYPTYDIFDEIEKTSEIKLGSPFIVGRAPLRVTPRPAMFELGDDGYCLYVPNASMHPEFSVGDVVIVSPALPIVSDCSCVFYAKFKDQEMAMIARLESYDDKHWNIKKWGFDRVPNLARSHWNRCHRIIGRQMR